MATWTEPAEGQGARASASAVLMTAEPGEDPSRCQAQTLHSAAQGPGGVRQLAGTVPSARVFAMELPQLL